MNILNREYFTIIISLLLLIIIVISKSFINDNSIFYFLIVINLLIIISCLVDTIKKNIETFNNYNILQNNNFEKTKNCFNRSKLHNIYHNKINKRLNFFRELEEKDRKIEELTHEKIKLKELENMNMDYLANGETLLI